MNGKKTFALRIFLIVLCILWMGVIFFLSAENSDESGGRSGDISFEIVRFFTQNDTDMTDAERQEIAPSHNGTYVLLLRSRYAVFSHGTHLPRIREDRCVVLRCVRTYICNKRRAASALRTRKKYAITGYFSGSYGRCIGCCIHFARYEDRKKEKSS